MLVEPLDLLLRLDSRLERDKDRRQDQWRGMMSD